MSHPLVLALFLDHAGAAQGARAMRVLGIADSDLSIVVRSHDSEGRLARELGGTPGSELEDSRPAARLGELGAQIVAAIAVVMPGIGPIVAAGPLAAEFGEAAGHVAGGVASVLVKAGVPEDRATVWQARVEQGAILLGVHVRTGEAADVCSLLERSGPEAILLATWS